MKKPEAVLPLWYDEISGNIYDCNDDNVSQDSDLHDADYLCHAANIYPKLVKQLTFAANMGIRVQQNAVNAKDKSLQDFINNTNQLLKECNQ